MKRNDRQHSFVILGYKDSPYLERCIKSLLNQTMKSKILLSTSTPSPYIEKVTNRYGIPISISPGGSIGSDWNYAYNASKTKYLTLAHQDDIYLPKYTEECLKKVSENTLIVFTDYEEIDKDNKILVKNLNIRIKQATLTLLKVFNDTTSNKYIKKILFSFCNPIGCPSVLYDKENIGTFSFNEKLRFTLDWEAWIQMVRKRGNISYTQEVLMYHRIHEGSETVLQTSNRNRIIEEKEIFNRLWPRYLANVLSKIYRYNSC